MGHGHTQPDEGIHDPIAWEFENSADRGTFTVAHGFPRQESALSAADIGRWAIDLDTGATWRLASLGPTTWQSTGGGGGGAQGAQGAQGTTGAQGLQGNQGSTGSGGSVGAQGAQGSAGSGSQGSQGSTGSQGLQGFQGFQGLQGAVGAQGLQGFQGLQGSQGSQGATGAQGLQGFQGSQGSQGQQAAQLTGTYYQNMLGAVSSSNVAGAPNQLKVSPLAAEGPLPMPFNITASSLMMDFFISGGAATESIAASTTFWAGIYTVSSDSLSLINSVSFSFGYTLAAGASASFAGSRFVSFASSAWSSAPAFAQGSQYYFAWMYSSSGVSSLASMFVFGQSPPTGQRSGFFGANGVSATSNGQAPFLGNYSVTTGALPTTIGPADLQKTGVNAIIIPRLILNANSTLSVF